MPTDDYIKRSDAIEELCGQCRFYDPSNDCKVKACFVATRKDQINAIPAADVEPVRHGHWIPINRINPVWGQFGIAQHKCSECGSEEGIARKRCPECGAKMMEEEEDG